MPVRTTSKITFKEISEDGTKVKQKDAIYKIVKELCSNFTMFEDVSLREIKLHTNFDINAISARVNELKKEHMLIECDKRRCSISNRLITPVRPLTIQETVDAVIADVNHYVKLNGRKREKDNI